MPSPLSRPSIHTQRSHPPPAPPPLSTLYLNSPSTPSHARLPPLPSPPSPISPHTHHASHSPHHSITGGGAFFGPSAGVGAGGSISPSPLHASPTQMSGFDHFHQQQMQLALGGQGQMALLVPTDRPVHELEETWLPKLGRLKVDREVSLSGYALYGIRPWFLSRTHWAHSIVSQTGKANEHVSCYVLIPDPELPVAVRERELSNAIQFLADETRSHPKRTEHGTLLVTTPAGYGQEITFIPSGDFRETRPYILLNTGLRRLGCGGRAAMGMESPLPAVRRKYYESYRLPMPSGTGTASHSQSRQTSPTASPTVSSQSTAAGGMTSLTQLATDPITASVIEMVRLIQAALAIWGLYGQTGTDAAGHEVPELDGLFCDETKAGILRWRKDMGVEHEDSSKLERETSGGCIDPKTLAALLSSITSARYQMAALGIEKIPKDPFTNIKRFLHAWHNFLVSAGKHASTPEHFTVAGLHLIISHYVGERKGHATDALKVHRLLLSGVASATSSISANLKGGAPEDTPLRKREHHLRFKGDGAGGDLSDSGTTRSGLAMIIPEGEVGPVAPPDVITTDLEAYTRAILRTRDKDLDLMGARRLSDLWNGHVVIRDSHGHAVHGAEKHERRLKKLEAIARRRPTVISEEEDSGGAIGAFRKTGQALKGGFNLVARRGTTYETSDSDAAAGPGPSSIRQALARRKQSSVPTVVEPDVEEIDEQLGPFSNSPSPSASNRFLDLPFGTTASSRLSVGSRATSKRPSISTNPSNDGSDGNSFVASVRLSAVQRGARTDDELGLRRTGEGGGGVRSRPLSMAERALVWRNRGRATTMLRTASDGADVELEEGGMEWEVLNPHGTGRGRPSRSPRPQEVKPVRRHSLQPHSAYDFYRVSQPEHMAADVELCALVLELRAKERDMAQRAQDMVNLERSVFTATQNIIDAFRTRRDQIEQLESQVRSLERDLHRSLDEVDSDSALAWASKKIEFYLSEDTNTHEIMWALRELERWWRDVREAHEVRKKQVEEEEVKRAWWRLGL